MDMVSPPKWRSYPIPGTGGAGTRQKGRSYPKPAPGLVVAGLDGLFCRHAGGDGIKDVTLDALTGCGCGGADGCAGSSGRAHGKRVLAALVCLHGTALGIGCHGITSKMA